jgi:hypothetical protein
MFSSFLPNVNDLISEYFLTEEGMIQINDPEIKAVFL